MRRRNNIEWEIGQAFDDAGDGHTFFHYATGVDEHGNKFKGVAILVDDSLEEMEDVEMEEAAV